VADPNTVVNVGQALDLYAQSLRTSTPEIHQGLARFGRWCGRDRPLEKLTPPEVADYARFATHKKGVEAERGFKAVREFLLFLNKKGISQINLATHLRAPRATRVRETFSANRNLRESSPVLLTREGHAQLVVRLEGLRKEMISTSQEIKLAAADKDVRENAPLEAAREHQGLLAFRAQDIEATLARAQIIDGKTQVSTSTVRQGSRILLKELTTGKQCSYLVVDPRESNPLEGKLSTASPVGSAVMDRKEGEEFEVRVPRGSIRYLIARIE
jgi:transcription elongation factor GreA